MDKKENMKKNVIDISKIVIFLSICGFILCLITPIFLPKNNTKKSGIKYENARGFYGEKNNSIDVVALGNSDLYSALNPLELWKSHGYTSYVCAEPSQNIFSAYYLLKDIFSCQKPKLVILEVDEFFTRNEADDIDDAFSNILKNKFPLFEYHSRWKTLKVDDFNTKVSYTSRMESKGYIYHNVVKANKHGFKYMNNKNKNSEITYTTNKYIEKTIDLAKSHGANVLLVWYPSTTTGTTERHKTIQKLADQYHIPFLDFNVNQYDTGFNWSTDTRDGGNHLNYNGATKMTKYLGKYLNENYNLKDHRQDKAYHQWNLDYQSFMKKNKLL